MNYIVVNYHYIKPEKLRGLNPCTEENFQKQLGYLRANYTMASVAKVYQAGISGQAGKFCALTFDDGLKEHYGFVFPTLKKYSIPGTFFLSGEILRDRKVSLTHKLQFLLWRFDTVNLVAMFHKFFNNKYHIDDKVKINPRRRFDDVITVNFKETLMILPLAERAAFINDVFGKYYDEAKIADEFFINPAEAQHMIRGGMEIGAHGFRHLSLEVLSPAEQRHDIESGIAALAETISVKTEVFSYPHGRANSDTLEILRANGFKYGVTIKPEDVNLAVDPLLIPRYDANDIKVF